MTDAAAYCALLGYYLGDGCISQAPRYQSLRIACDARYPKVISDVRSVLGCVRPGMAVFTVRAPGTIVVHANWKHWECLFPQHGAGRKHERELGMQTWQWALVEAHPAEFLRGLLHSDGSRSNNWAARKVGGVTKRYEYPRWEFSNRSEEILGWCGDALDLVDVAWRRSSNFHVAVSRRADVNRLDSLIGLKA